MRRPMYDMLLAASQRTSLHMPGSQGRAPFGKVDPYLLDTTELGVTDDLYHPCAGIREAQRLAALSAGAAHTLMLHGGSTAGIHAMLLYAVRRGQKVILPRNVHISAVNLCATAGLLPVFAAPDVTPDGLPCTTQDSYLAALRDHPDAKAMLVVRPDYYGTAIWPQAAVQRAHEMGLTVLCDEAHGAHFNWDAAMPNAGELGADLFVQSAHKTLPALTGGAWLHAMHSVDADRLRGILRMVQTSSPSFIQMMALDDARAWMDENGAQAIARLKTAAARFYERARQLGYRPVQSGALPYDATRIAIQAPEGGFALDDALAKRGLDVEMSDERRVVCILSLMDGETRLHKLLTALEQIAGTLPVQPDDLPAPPRCLPPVAMPPCEAAFAPTVRMAPNEAVGRVSAGHVGLYPPGVGVLAAGERITREAVDYLMRLQRSRIFGMNDDGTLNCVETKELAK